MSMTGKPIWQLPVQGVTVTEVSRKIMATIDIRSPYGQYRVEWVSPDGIPHLQQILAQFQMTSYYNASPYTSYPQPGSFPTLAPQQPSQWQQSKDWYRVQSRPVQIIVGIVVIACTLFVGSAACTGTVQGIAQSFAPATPTAQIVQATQATQSQAVQASTPTTVPTIAPTPTPSPTPRPTPTATPVQQPTGVNGNPWGYDFTSGNLIYNPPADFCSYFACISNFWNGHGYVNECQDSNYSLSGGIRGDCSHHGGELQPLYSH